MKTPKDQGLFFTVFFSVSLVIILTSWLLIPAHVKIGEEEDGGDENKPKPVYRGEKAILESEVELTKADEILNRLEKEEAEKKDKEKKTKGKKPGKTMSDKNQQVEKNPKESDAKTTTTKK